MTYELKIVADTKEELIALLEGAPFMDVPKEAIAPEASQPVVMPAEPAQSAPVEDKPAAQVAPQPEKAYTMEQLAMAAAPLMDNPEGVRMLQELLASYKVPSLTDLDKSLYGDFAEKLRQLGVSV